MAAPGEIVSVEQRRIGALERRAGARRRLVDDQAARRALRLRRRAPADEDRRGRPLDPPGGRLPGPERGSTLGLGWLGALLVLSGSPIAATSLTLVAAGEQAVERVLGAPGLHDADRLAARRRVRRARHGGDLRAPRRRGAAEGAGHVRDVRALRDGDDLHPGGVHRRRTAQLGHVPLARAQRARAVRRPDRRRLRRDARPRRDLLGAARVPRRARRPAARVQADRHGPADARPGLAPALAARPAHAQVADVLPRLPRRARDDVDLGRARRCWCRSSPSATSRSTTSCRTSSARTSRRSATRCSPRSRSTRPRPSGSCSPR